MRTNSIKGRVLNSVHRERERERGRCAFRRLALGRWAFGRWTIVPVLALAAATAAAHHSAALFYKIDERITVSGTVEEFRFSNPHAVLLFEVTGDDGEAQQWTAETTSPSILRRRGWNQQSFTPGESVTIEGMPSVDGSYLIRITRAFREDGSEIGIPRGTDN